MSKISNPFQSTDSSMRPFDPRRDLNAVADLIEQCFRDTLDHDGERYLQQMRSAAQNKALTQLASATGEWASIPMNGYVWEVDGQVVGNLSLIPYYVHGQRLFLIANVGVLPDYRRQGIARALTLQGIEHARKRGAPSVWLHVRADNAAAVSLYQALSFKERSRRTTWISRPELPAAIIPPSLTFGWPTGAVWDQQRSWLEKTYPTEVTWHLPLKIETLQPGLWGTLKRFFNGLDVQQWTVQSGKRLLGVLSCQNSGAYARHLWLATSPENDAIAVQALLSYVRQKLGLRQPLTLDYPAERAVEAIQGAGFNIHQTLIWMEIALNAARHAQ